LVRIIFRTDASQQIGSGHVMRCLALAESLHESGAMIEFVTRDHLGNLNDYIQSKVYKIHVLQDQHSCETHKISTENEYEQWHGVNQEKDAEETIDVLTSGQIHWLIVDHYALDYKWEEIVKPYVNKIMVIDDLANRKHDCDLLLDQNYYAQDRYDKLISPASTKLLGPKYALLRKEFSEYKQSNERKNKTIDRVFVFFGGSDPDNLTATALRALSQSKLNYLSVDVVIGAANSHRAEVKALVAEKLNATLHIQVENIAELMSKADIALGAGGTTTWERMVVGLPSIVITIADNQISFTKELDKDEYLKWLGSAENVNQSKIYDAILFAVQNTNQLKAQAIKGQALVTGMGAQILARLLIEGPKANNLHVRRALSSDCLLYWSWVNDPVVRESASNKETITWDDHQSWFFRRLDDVDSVLLLIECEFAPLGQVRFDKSEQYYILDYSIAKQFRGYGLAKSMLMKAIDFFGEMHPSRLIAEVIETNLISSKVLEQLGFKEDDSSECNGVRRYLLEYPYAFWIQ